MNREPQGSDKEEKEFIEGMLKLLEPLLAEDWNTEADEWWNSVKGVKITSVGHKEAQ